MTFALLTLLALALALYAYEWRDSRREDALWEVRRKRLAALNKSRPSSFNPDLFEFAPGAMWIVSDPRDVAVLA